MGKIVVFAAGVVMMTMLSVMVLAEQGNNTPAVQKQQLEQSKPMADQAKTGSKPKSGKAELSRHNKAMIDVAEQHKLRQIQIDAERAAAARSK